MPLRFETGLDDSGFLRGLRNMDRGAMAFATKLKGIGATLGVSLGTGAAISGMKSLIDHFSQLNDEAATLSLKPERFQRLSAAVEIAGATQEDFVKGYAALARALDDAREKGGEASAAFIKLGISQHDIDTQDTEQIWFRISDALKASGNDVRSFSAASEILGSRVMLKLSSGLQQGSAEMRRIGEAADVAKDKTVDFFDKAGDSMQKFGRDLRNTLGNNISGGIEAFKGEDWGGLGKLAGTAGLGLAKGGPFAALWDLMNSDAFGEQKGQSGGGAASSAPSRNAMFARNLAVESRKAAEEAKRMADFKKEDQKFLNDLLREQKDIDEDLLQAAEIRHETLLESLDSYDRIKTLEQDRLGLVEQINAAGDKERAGLNVELAQLDDRIAKEKQITAEKGIRSAMSEDGGRLAPALTRRDLVGDRAAESLAEAESRKIGGSALRDLADETARSRFDFEGVFGKGKRAPNGKPILGPWPDEPPRRGMGERDQELGRQPGGGVSIRQESMDQFAKTVSTQLTSDLAEKIP